MKREFQQRTSFCVHATAVVIAVLVFLCSPHVRADFINGGFQSPYTGNPSQPFTGWTVEYNAWQGIPPAYTYSPWLATPPSGHPGSAIATSATIGNVTLPPPCGTQMARINDLSGTFHATRISQTVTLTAADIDVCGTATVRVCWIGGVDNPNDSDHDDSQQPFFSFSLEHHILATGVTSVVDTASYPSRLAAAPGSGWSNAGPSSSGGTFWYRNTCTPLRVLNASPGDTVTVRMTVRDCSLGAHGAVAYLDCAEILPGPPSGGSRMLQPVLWNTAVTSSLGLHAGDFDADGRCDLADYLVTGSIRVLRSTGSSFAAPLLAASVPTNWQWMVTGDFDGDGSSDVAGWDGVSLRVVWADSTTTALDFAATQTTWTTPGGVGAGGRYWVGDFDGDLADDLVRDTGTNIEVAIATRNRSSPFTHFGASAPWAASGATIGGFYTYDCNRDGLCDVFQSLTTGIHLLTSTGTSFAPLTFWRPEGPPIGGWTPGDFDCDNSCEIIQRVSSGVLELLDLVPPPFNGRGNLGQISTTTVGPGPFVAGDFDGNGRDDVAHIIQGFGVEVLRSCTGCDCMIGSASEPVCNYPDRNSYTLQILMNNRTGGSIDTFTVAAQPPGSFSVTPSTIVLLSPLHNRRSTTISVVISGVTPNSLQCVNVTGHWTVNGQPQSCTTPVCFRAPVCDCMDLFNESMICRPDGSGVLCYDFTVRNTSGINAHWIRLSPGSAFSPSLIPLPPLASGSTFTPTPCSVHVVVPGPSVLTYHVELLDSAMNLICDEERSVDVPDCPTVYGECCVPRVGIQSMTFAQCAAAGGTWTPPGTSQYCPVNASNMVLQPVGGASITTNNQLRTFVTLPNANSGVDMSFNAGASLLVPIEAFDPPLGAQFSVDVSGSTGSRPAVAASVLQLFGTMQGQDAFVDFASVSPKSIRAHVTADKMYPSVTIPGSMAVIELATAPSAIKLIPSELPNESHGLSLIFDTPTMIVVPGHPAMIGTELSLFAADTPQTLAYFTKVKLRASNMPYFTLGPLNLSLETCDADLNGDCVIDAVDVDCFNHQYNSSSSEADLNYDGVVDFSDLLLLATQVGTTCPCNAPPPTCPADANGDSQVNSADLSVLLSQFGSTVSPGSGADFNSDGVVNSADLSILLSRWGMGC